MARDFASPAYQRIAGDWVRRIDRGEVEDGFRLPTRQELADEHHVSLQVIRDALALLHTEGYVRSVPSKGTYVNRPLVIELAMNDFEADGRERDAFFALVEDLGHTARHDLRIETVLGDDPGLPPGLDVRLTEDVAVRRRVRYVDGKPYSISDSFYPARLVAGTPITSPADITRGARHVLEELGHGMRRHRDTIECRRPHPTEVALLDIAPGLSVTAHTRVSYTEDGTPIRLLASVLPSDRWRLTYEVSP